MYAILQLQKTKKIIIKYQNPWCINKIYVHMYAIFQIGHRTYLVIGQFLLTYPFREISQVLLNEGLWCIQCQLQQINSMVINIVYVDVLQGTNADHCLTDMHISNVWKLL